jgi:general secretion pathway protein G
MRKKRRVIFFTLMEMAVVVAVIAMLGTIVTPLYFRHLKKARINTAKTQVILLQQAVFDYRIDTSKLPSSLDDLVKNSGDSRWDGPYLQGSLPKDPWDNNYTYVVPGRSSDFEIVSYGSDGQPGGDAEAADISNWN